MSDELSEAYALHHAAKAGHLTIVQRLLDTGKAATYFDLMDSRRRPVLWWPARQGNTVMVKLLLDALGNKVDSRDGNQTPLSIAAERGCADVVKLLLETNSVDPS
jgi:ankyrin repeat protein